MRQIEQLPRVAKLVLAALVQCAATTPSTSVAALAAALNCVLVSYLANSALIAFISGTAYTALLATRAVQLAVLLPVQCAVIYLLGRAKPVRDILDKISENP